MTIFVGDKKFFWFPPDIFHAVFIDNKVFLT